MPEIRYVLTGDSTSLERAASGGADALGEVDVAAAGTKKSADSLGQSMGALGRAFGLPVERLDNLTRGFSGVAAKIPKVALVAGGAALALGAVGLAADAAWSALRGLTESAGEWAAANPAQVSREMEVALRSSSDALDHLDAATGRAGATLATAFAPAVTVAANALADLTIGATDAATAINEELSSAVDAALEPYDDMAEGGGQATAATTNLTASLVLMALQSARNESALQDLAVAADVAAEATRGFQEDTLRGVKALERAKALAAKIRDEQTRDATEAAKRRSERLKEEEHAASKMIPMWDGQTTAASRLRDMYADLERQSLALVDAQLGLSVAGAEATDGWSWQDMALLNEQLAVTAESTDTIKESLSDIGSTALRAAADVAGALSGLFSQIAANNEAALDDGKARVRDLRDDMEGASAEERQRIQADITVQRAANQERRRDLRRLFEADRIAQVGSIASLAAVAVVQALAQLGPIAGTIAAAGIGAVAALQVGTVAAQQNPYPIGGVQTSDSRSTGHVPAMLEPGEGVLTQAAVARAGGEAAIARMNDGRAEQGERRMQLIFRERVLWEMVESTASRRGVSLARRVPGIAPVWG